MDKAFESVVLKICGRQIYDSFRKEKTEDWIYLYRQYKKRALPREKKDRIFIKFSRTLIEMYTAVSGNEISEAISTFKGKIEVIGDKMNFSNECFKSFFADSSQKIIAHVQCILKDCDVKAIVMVGGYSESNDTATYQSMIPIRNYASDQVHLECVDEGACFVGELTVTISDPDADLRREIVVCLTFSGTEILVEAEDKKAKKSFRTAIDFLG